MADYRTLRMTVPSDAQAVATGKPYATDLFVDPTTNELVLVDDAHAVAQHVGQRIHTFFGEWFLDDQIGVQWLTEVMSKYEGDGIVIAEALLREEITATPGVRDIFEMELSYSRTTRGIETTALQIETDFDATINVNDPF